MSLRSNQILLSGRLPAFSPARLLEEESVGAARVWTSVVGKIKSHANDEKHCQESQDNAKHLILHL